MYKCEFSSCHKNYCYLQNKKALGQEVNSEESEDEGPKKKRHHKMTGEEWTDPWARGGPEKKVKKKKKKEKV